MSSYKATPFSSCRFYVIASIFCRSSFIHDVKTDRKTFGSLIPDQTGISWGNIGLCKEMQNGDHGVKEQKLTRGFRFLIIINMLLSFGKIVQAYQPFLQHFELVNWRCMCTLFAKNAYEVKLKGMRVLMIILKICYVDRRLLEAQSTLKQYKQVRNLHFNNCITHFLFSFSFFFPTVSWPIYLISENSFSPAF